MTRLRLSQQRGMTLIEVMVTVLVICTGTLATIGTYVHFSKATRKARERAVVASVAQREIEQMRPVAYDQLGLTSSPDAQAAAEAPLQAPAASEPVVTGGVVRPGGDTFAVRGVKGRIYRYVTYRNQVCGALNASVQGQLAGLLGQTVSAVSTALPNLCPVTSKTKRLTVVVVPLNDDGQPGGPLRLSTVVTDPSLVALDVLNDQALSLANATKQATDGLTPSTETVGTQTLHLTDTRCNQAARQTPSDHATRDTSQQALTCTASGPAPTLMTSSPLTGGVGDPLFDFSTDVTRAVAGGRVLLRDSVAGGCTAPTEMVYTNAETASRMGAFHTWATIPPPSTLETPLTSGRASLTFFTSTTTGQSAPGRLCVTLRRASDGTVIGSEDFRLGNWPGTTSPLVTTMDLNHVVVPAGERLLLTLRVPADSGSDLRVVYDHVAYPSALSYTVISEPDL